MSLKYTTREYLPGTEQAERDRKFWMDAWLNSYKKSPYAGVVPNHLYVDLHAMVINRQVLEARGAKITMVTHPHDPDRFIAFLCHEEGVLHYMYVKEAYRGNHLGSQLLNQVVGKKFSYTFRTAKWDRFMATTGGWTARHSPELLRVKVKG